MPPPLPLNKLYIDSKFKTDDSASDSNFRIQLPISIDFPENTYFIIDDICIPHAWYSIETGINDTIWIDLYDYNLGANPTPTEIQIKVPAGNYSGAGLNAAITTAITTAFATSTPSSIINLTPVIIFAYNAQLNNITMTPIAARYGVKLLTDNDLRTGTHSFAGKAFSVPNINSMNDVFRNYGTSPIYTNASIYSSGFLNLTLVNNIYISSPNLGCFTTLTANGEQSVIKKVPVSADFGYMIQEKVQANHHQLECSRVTLSTLEFHLKDCNGRYIPLHGSNISFTLIFQQHND